MPATDDPALARLLDAYAEAAREYGRYGDPWDAPGAELVAAEAAARAALLDHLDRAYVRRDRLHDDGPWDHGDGSAYGDALAREGAPGA